MQVIVKGTNVKVSPAVKEHAEKRIQKLTRYFSKFDEAKVTCRAERNWQIVDVTLHAGGLVFRKEEKSDDLTRAIDAAADKLERQLKKFREKINDRLRKEDSSLTGAIDEQLHTELEEKIEAADHHGNGVVRRKSFPLKPMPLEEALLQLELLHHDFFVFTNLETEQVNVIYRRGEGGYGLIEPEA